MSKLIILCLLVFTGCCRQSAKPGTFRVVDEIGGCDIDGYCGVGFTDGTFGRAMFPVKGQKIYE